MPKPRSKKTLTRKLSAPKPPRTKSPQSPTTESKLAASQKARDARLRATFNICSQEYEQVLAAQNGRCAISLKIPKTVLHIDHDHRSGLVRGLLDPWANKGLSYFQDDPEQLRRAADYLENPPFSKVLGEDVYGVTGRVTKKARNRRYGPDGSREPKMRTTGPLAGIEPKPPAKPKPKAKPKSKPKRKTT